MSFCLKSGNQQKTSPTSLQLYLFKQNCTNFPARSLFFNGNEVKLQYNKKLPYSGPSLSGLSPPCNSSVSPQAHGTLSLLLSSCHTHLGRDSNPQLLPHRAFPTEKKQFKNITRGVTAGLNPKACYQLWASVLSVLDLRGPGSQDQPL